jgi:hypothetical protein
MWEERRKEAEFRSVEAQRLLDIAKEETAQLSARAQEVAAMSSMSIDARQLAELQLAKSQVCVHHRAAITVILFAGASGVASLPLCLCGVGCGCVDTGPVTDLNRCADADALVLSS